MENIDSERKEGNEQKMEKQEELDDFWLEVVCSLSFLWIDAQFLLEAPIRVGWQRKGKKRTTDEIGMRNHVRTE